MYSTKQAFESKQLSRSGFYDIEFILAQVGIDPNDSRRICYETLKYLGEIADLIKKQGDDYKTWSRFSTDICPETWDKFFHKKCPITARAYFAFCKLLRYLDPSDEFDGQASETIDLSHPSVAAIIFKQCRQQIDVLLSVAEQRLLINENCLDKQFEFYKRSLGIKNKEFLIDSEHEYLLDESDIFSGPIEISNCGKILKICLQAELSKNEKNSVSITWGVAMVNIATGCSELLLDNRPFVWAGHEIKLGDRIIRKVRLPKGVQLTAKAINMLMQACADHPGEQRISNFGGWLKDTNLTIFKHEYLRLRRAGETDEAGMQQSALLRTPFGKARNKMGISQFDIRIVERDERSVPKAVFIKSACYPGMETFAI